MKPAIKTKYPLHDLIKKRWSPRAFSERTIEKEKILTMFEAARWAASCYNEQPWNFLFATKENHEDFNNLLDCLIETNKIWAHKAPLLIMTVAKTIFDHNKKFNNHASHDIGLSIGNLTLQAASMNLYVHQMAGFNTVKAKSKFKLPEHFEPVSMIAVGYLGEMDSLPDRLKELEISPQKRKGLREMLFEGTWGNSYIK
jgi:nitroreductase